MIDTLLNKRWIPWVLACALFMETLDATVLNTAIPTMAIQFHVSPIDLKAALTSYIISLGILIPASGVIAERFGSRRVFMFALITFVIGSIFCSLTNNVTELVISRVIQGIGGGFMLPVSRFVFLKEFNNQERAKKMSFIVIPGLIGPLLGPTIGGVLTTYASWRWIFYINIPISIIGLVMAYHFFRPDKISNPPKFDWLGFILFGLGLACLSFMLDTVSQHYFSTKIEWGLAIASILLITGYIIRSQNIKAPLLNFAVFKISTFKLCWIAQFFLRLASGGTILLIPLLLQVEYGLTAAKAGLLYSCVFVGVISAKLVVNKILKQYKKYKWALVINTFCITGSILLFSFINPNHLYFSIAILICYGFFISIQMTAENLLAYSDVPSNLLAVATGFRSIAQQVFVSFGIGFAGILLNVFSVQKNFHLEGNLLSFKYTFLILAISVLINVFLYFRLSSRAGESMFAT